MSTNLLFKWFRREMAFFWLGMLIVPVFWVWWTLHPRFNRWERSLAMKWTVAWLTFVVVRMHDLPRIYDDACIAFPNVCATIALVLWILFFVRLMNFMVIILVDILAQISSLWHGRLAWEPFLFEPLVWVAVPLVLNLLLNPVHRAWQKLEKISITLTIPPRLRIR